MILVTLTGCGGTSGVKMSAQDRSTLHTVAVNPNVPMPQEMFYYGMAQNFATTLGGVVGALAGAAAGDEPRDQLLAVMKANNISIPETVRSEFGKELERSTPLRIADTGTAADAELSLAVNLYGLGIAHGFSSTLYPTLGVTATLKKPDGRVVWQSTNYVSPQSSENDLGHGFDEYLTQPELLRATWIKAAGIVSRIILAEFR